MRATRAYLAGLGTAGALLVGAAALCVAATAVLAFHAWPSIRGGGQPARQELDVAATRARRAQPIADVVARRPSATVRTSGAGRAPVRPRRAVSAGSHRMPSHPATRPVASVPISPAPSVHVAPGRHHPPSPSTHPVRRSPVTGTTATPVSASAPVTSAATGATTGAASSPPTTTTSPVVTPPLGTVTAPVSTVTAAVGTAVNQVGATVSGVGTAVGTTVGHVGAGTPVAPVTAGVGGIVTGVTTTVGRTVSTIAGILGG